MDDILRELCKPFHPSQVEWKPGKIKGNRAIALAYADLRSYMSRLDAVCGMNWSIEYKPWGDGRIIACLTINGVTRCSTGEMAAQDEKNEIGGTVAEAQAAKRACAMFGLGRYLYTLPSVWADFDPATKQLTSQAKAKLTNMLVQHYRRATEGKDAGDVAFGASEEASGTAAATAEALLDEFHALGEELYGDQWEKVCRRNASRISSGQTEESSELTHGQLQKLISGMVTLKNQRQMNGTAAS